MEGVGRQNWARGRIPIFRKIHLYAFLVKSTHGHTKKKPTQPFFRNLAIFGPPRQMDLPWTYPGPTLEHKGTYPRATLDLPWTYPGPTLDLP
jgi:hypothetical protein